MPGSYGTASGGGAAIGKQATIQHTVLGQAKSGIWFGVNRKNSNSCIAATAFYAGGRLCQGIAARWQWWHLQGAASIAYRTIAIVKFIYPSGYGGIGSICAIVKLHRSIVTGGGSYTKARPYFFIHRYSFAYCIAAATEGIGQMGKRIGKQWWWIIDKPRRVNSSSCSWDMK